MSMRIIITGATSFTGGWFARQLAANGHAVTAALSQDADFYRQPNAREHATRLRVIQQAGVDCRYATPFGSAAFFRLLEQQPPDILHHHAAHHVTLLGGKQPVAPSYRAIFGENHRSEMSDLTAAAAHTAANLPEVIDALKSRGCNRIVVTGSVFEMDQGGNSAERAVGNYGLVKYLITALFRHYAIENGLRIGHFVIPNPFGPYESERRFTPYLAQCWQRDDPATVNTPDYLRDNIHVSLLAKAYAKFMGELPATPGLSRFQPSGYVETQGEFAQRFAREMRRRTGLACRVSAREQSDFSQPMRLINDNRPDAQALDWREEQAWDDTATYYFPDHARRIPSSAAADAPQTPAVSILMLCYNRAQYMRQAIACVLTQTFTDFEFIIVDNGSQDDAVYTIAQEYAAQDARIILHREPQNHGTSGGRQIALQLARGQYIATLEDDDWWHADKLQKQIPFMRENPQVGLLCCSYIQVDAHGQEIDRVLLPDHITPQTTDASAAGFSAHTGKLHGSGFIARRDLLLQCGGFRALIQNCEDGDTFRRLEEVGATAAQSDCLIYYRKWGGTSWHGEIKSASARLDAVAAETSAYHRRANQPDPATECANVDDLLIRFFHACDFTGKDKWRSEWRVARSFLVLGKYAQLRAFLRARPAAERPRVLRLYAKILGWTIKLNRLGFWLGAPAAKQPR